MRRINHHWCNAEITANAALAWLGMAQSSSRQID
jgi:hypothetical protein